MTTVIASIWYSLHSALLMWLLWFLLYRDYRVDLLRSDLTLLDWEIADMPPGAERDDLHALVKQSEQAATYLTATRLLLSWWTAGRVPASAGSDAVTPAVAEARQRFVGAVANHARLPLLARDARGLAAIRIALETAATR